MATALHPRLREYAAFHSTSGNRACHWVGIPLIVVSLLGLFGRIGIFDAAGVSWSMAELTIAGSLLYYARLDARLAALMVPAIVPFDLLGRSLPAAVDGILFGIGWVFQLVGHAVYEKRSPAFFENVAHLLVGPLFLLAKAVGRA
jgi:uncharacterized membrane protein YGL010W